MEKSAEKKKEQEEAQEIFNDIDLEFDTLKKQLTTNKERVADFEKRTKDEQKRQVDLADAMKKVSEVEIPAKQKELTTLENMFVSYEKKVKELEKRDEDKWKELKEERRDLEKHVEPLSAEQATLDAELSMKKNKLAQLTRTQQDWLTQKNTFTNNLKNFEAKLQAEQQAVWNEKAKLDDTKNLLEDIKKEHDAILARADAVPTADQSRNAWAKYEAAKQSRDNFQSASKLEKAFVEAAARGEITYYGALKDMSTVSDE